MAQVEPSQPVVVAHAKSDGEVMQALAIREVVFIEEQHIPAGSERDAADASAFHVLAYQGGHAIGTGRLVMLPAAPEGSSGTWAQVSRMAVLQAHRKGGVGSRMLQALEEEARRRKVTGLVLHAQVSALDFYRRHGYEAFGGVYEEPNTGMAHLEMHKVL